MLVFQASSPINVAADYIKAGLHENVVVVGCDVISDFVLFGFESLFALSDEMCKPFDENRKGINLGEGSAVVILSKHQSVFKGTSFDLCFRFNFQ